ncbi:SNAP25-like proteinous protein [Vigna angularis]|uniref:SNAP25-like proteinous protein n=1 Tax=Phaseolus angularis TaxID=3914 RepID=A0A8T0JP99_PHAAN|nr:SNAP25-like proteinous protein [Vigna angularis]
MPGAKKSHLKDAKPSSIESWTNPFDSDDEEKHTKKLENQSVKELESSAVYKAEETTNSVDNCMKFAENIREVATKTLVTLHQQGEQITRSHHVAVNIDHDLSRGEKLLGSLGGLQKLETKEDTSNNRPSYCWRLMSSPHSHN